MKIVKRDGTIKIIDSTPIYLNLNLFDLVIVTNDLNRSSKEIAVLYKSRWQIELFFKWIKQNLRIKHWIGHNENAIKIQLYSALIAYILIRLIQEEINNKYSILKITRIIRVYITKKVNLLSVFIS